MIGGEGVALIEYYTPLLVKIDGFTFTRTNENQIRLGFTDFKSAPDTELIGGDIKRFVDGVRVRCEIDFTFDDWDATVSDTLVVSCQTFLRNLHNHTGPIKITPHIDKAQVYWVLRENQWQYSYPYQKWLGVKGTLVFIGSEKIAAIDIVE